MARTRVSKSTAARKACPPSRPNTHRKLRGAAKPKPSQPTRQSARKGLRLWLMHDGRFGTSTVMMPGWWTHRKARVDAKMLADAGLTVQIRRGRTLLREVRAAATAAKAVEAWLQGRVSLPSTAATAVPTRPLKPRSAKAAGGRCSVGGEAKLGASHARRSQ